MQTAPARARISDADPSGAEMEARFARFHRRVPPGRVLGAAGVALP